MKSVKHSDPLVEKLKHMVPRLKTREAIMLKNFIRFDSDEYRMTYEQVSTNKKGGK